MQLMLIYASRCVAADPKGWQLEYDDTDLEVRSPDGNAELRVRPYECTPSPTLKELYSRITLSAKSNLDSIVETQVGQYFGYAFDAVDPSDDMFIRDHVVSLAEIMLDVTFSCANGSQDHYLPLVQPIIESLSDNRP